MVKIISQKTLFQAVHFSVKENILDFGNGVQRTHHDVYRNDAVSIFPVTETYDIYLIRQFRYLHNAEILEAIAGMADNKESPLITAARELKEEAGIVAKELVEFKTIALAGSIFKASQHFVLARNFSLNTAEPEETEKITLVKMSLGEAVQKVMTGEIFTAGSIIGILLLDKMRQEGNL